MTPWYVAHLDFQVGRLLERLDELGLRDSTFDRAVEQPDVVSRLLATLRRRHADVAADPLRPGSSR